MTEGLALCFEREREREMNGLQLSYLLSMDPYTSSYFGGFAMRDSKGFSEKQNYSPVLYILNTDTEAGEGEHWCCVVFERDTAEFFDPFGMPPDVYGFADLLNSRPYKKLVHNNLCVQNILSSVCGHHCFFYAYYKARKYPLSKIISMYDTENTRKNDAMVLKFVLDNGECYRPLNKNMMLLSP